MSTEDFLADATIGFVFDSIKNGEVSKEEVLAWYKKVTSDQYEEGYQEGHTNGYQSGR